MTDLKLDMEKESNRQSELLMSTRAGKDFTEGGDDEGGVLFPYEDPATVGVGLPWQIRNMMQMGAGGRNVLRQIGNIPGDVIETAELLKDLIFPFPAAPAKAADTMSRAVQGAVELGLNATGVPFLQSGDTRNSQIARQMGSAIIDRVTNPGRTVVEEPVQSLLDLSGLGPAARIARAPKFATATRAVSPIDLVRRGSQSTGKYVGKGAEAGTGQLSSFTTGFPPAAFEKMSEAGARFGKVARERVWTALTENRFLEQIGEDVIVGLKKIKEDMSLRYQDRLSKIKYKDSADPINLEEFKAQTMGIMEEELKAEAIYQNGRLVDIKPSKGGVSEGTYSPPSKIGIGDRSQLDAAMDVLEEINAWTDDTPVGLDVLKQKLGNLYETNVKHKEAGRFTSVVQKNLREKLGEKVSGYDEMTSDYAKVSGQLDEFDTIFRSGAESREAFLNKLTDLIKEPANFDMRRRVMEDLVVATGHPVVHEVAGALLSQWAPKGLIGRSYLAGAATGIVGTGAFFDAHLAAGMLVLLPLASPKVMGAFFQVVVGGGKRNYAKFAEGTMRKIHAAIPPGMITEGLTVGAIIQQLDKDKKRESRTPAQTLFSRTSGRPIPVD